MSIRPTYAAAPAASFAPVKGMTVSLVKAAAAAHFGVEVADIEGRNIKQPLSRQRQIAITVAYRLTVRSLTEIGRAFGGRDHTTVRHAILSVEADPDACDMCHEIGRKAIAALSVEHWTEGLGV